MRLLLITLFLFGTSSVISAQEFDLPRKSPRANTEFTVGLTNVNIAYSSPAVRGRDLWGNLVPYEQVWRAGANEATIISFSRDIYIEGQALAAGDYAFFMVPREDNTWTAIFNKQTEQWGSYDYDEKNDALRVEVAVDTLCQPEERLQYYLSDTDLDAGTICLRWEYRSLCLNFSVKVLDQIEEQLASKLQSTTEEEAWRLYAEVADFLKTYDSFRVHALSFAIQSTAQFDHVWNWWLRAQIEQEMGDVSSAIISAEKAINVGKTSPEDLFFQRSQSAIEGALQAWKTEIGKKN